MGGISYHSLFGTRLWSSPAGGLIALAPDCAVPTGEISMETAISSVELRASFLFLQPGAQITSEEAANNLLISVYNALGKYPRGVVWIKDKTIAVMPLSADTSTLCGDFKAHVAQNLTLTIGNHSRLTYNESCQGFSFLQQGLIIRFSSTGYVYNIYDVCLPLIGAHAGVLTFLTQLAYNDFVRYFPVGFDYLLQVKRRKFPCRF